MNKKVLYAVFISLNLVLYIYFFTHLGGSAQSKGSMEGSSKSVKNIVEISSPLTLERDPFNIPQNLKPPKKKESRPLENIEPDFVIKGIMFSSESSEIFVNDIMTGTSEVLKVGDRIKNTKVTLIEKEFAIVEVNGRKFRLKVNYFEPL